MFIVNAIRSYLNAVRHGKKVVSVWLIDVIDNYFIMLRNTQKEMNHSLSRSSVRTSLIIMRSVILF